MISFFNLRNKYSIRKLITVLFISLGSSVFAIYFNINALNKKDMENILIMQTKYDNIKIELFPDVAPNHVKRIKQLVKKGSYDNGSFYRAIEGFIVEFQCTEDKSILPTINAELTKKYSFNQAGVIGVSRGKGINSATGCELFITEANDLTHLDNSFTIIGYLPNKKDMEIVKKIKHCTEEKN